ncbi:hypothetical protein ACIBG8_30455 [Nonomuraea sp. NPDC050556]|uniref:hypothetical protein n=1 Tax=Nonomuraea sp. NPDC050556 TaxID=3364369 RepID=UPI0037AA585E
MPIIVVTRLGPVTAASMCVIASMATVGPSARADARVDPVGAIQRQLVPGHGVKIVQRARLYMSGGWSTAKPVYGVVGFGKGKVVATDLKNPNLGLNGTRNICIGEQGYESYLKPDPDDPIPPDKTWVTYEGTCRLALQSGYVSLTDPVTLRAVLATTERKRPAGAYDGVRTSLYEGSITFEQLYKANPDMAVALGFRPTGEYASWKVRP